MPECAKHRRLALAQSGRQLVADRYSYLACMPLVLLAAVVLERAGRGRATETMQRGALRGVPLVVVLAWLSNAYSAVWKDSFSLWDHAVKGAPECAFARTHRGMLYMLQGDGTRALADFDAALRVDPDAAETLESRALLYRKAGRIDDALADLAHAIAVRPDGAVAFANRGAIRFERGDARGALDDFESAVRIDDASSTNWFNVAIAKERLGDVAGARAATLAALEREPPGTPFRRRMQQALDGLP
jgi:tetratricopeptide (TPR) repeat protein